VTKFTRAQIKEEIKELNEGKLSYTDSPVYNEWCEIASEWFINDVSDYLLDGFVGFRDRTGSEIMLDFHLNRRLVDELSDDEVEIIFKT
jgi:hypothetical protein